MSRSLELEHDAETIRTSPLSPFSTRLRNDLAGGNWGSASPGSRVQCRRFCTRGRNGLATRAGRDALSRQSETCLADFLSGRGFSHRPLGLQARAVSPFGGAFAR